MTQSTTGFNKFTASTFQTSYNYVYQYKDHLGNVRLSYSDTDKNGSINANTEIIEEKNYYPFGLQHKGYNNVVNGSENNHFTYNGKELEESFGLDVIEMDWRHYDPALGKFNGIDPITHFSQGTSVAFDNNPIYWADPSGANGEHYNWRTGRYENDKGEEVSFETAMSSVDDDIRIWGKNDEGNDVLLVNLITDEIDADIRTDVVASEEIGFVTRGHDPFTNKTNENESGALFEYNIDKFLPEFLSEIPKGDNGILSLGLENSFIKGISSSMDLAFFQNESGSLDAVAAYMSTGQGWGVSLGAGLLAGYVTSKDGNPLSLRSFEGDSSVYSLGFPGAKVGGSRIDSSAYYGRTFSVFGAGGGLSKMNVNSRLIGGWGNLNQY